MGNFNIYLEKVSEFITTYGMRFLGAIIALVLGLWLIKLLTNALRKGFEKRKLDKSLKTFFMSFISVTLKTLLIISVLGMIGVQMTSFIAIIGAVGLAIGMALSGTLQNLAGGVMILIFRPYKIGDTISAQGYTGTVKEIQIFNTILRTSDSKIIIIPNGGLANNSMTNFSTEPERRVEWTFGIGYGNDVDKARSVLLNLIGEDKRISKYPEPFIAVSELTVRSVNLAVRVWVNAPDYWNVFFDINEKVYKIFIKEGLNIS